MGAGWKLAATLGVVVALIAVPVGAWGFLAGTAAGLGMLTRVSRVPFGFLVRRVLLLELFAVGVIVMAVFQPGGWGLAAFLGVRTALCLFAMMLLANTTPFGELVRVMKRMRVPALLVTTVSLMYRYLFVLADESERMRRARMCRSFSGRRAGSWRLRATVISQLFLRSSERADRIYGAMSARGWR